MTFFCDIFRRIFLPLRHNHSIVSYGKGNVIALEESEPTRRVSDIGTDGHYTHQQTAVQIPRHSQAGVFQQWRNQDTYAWETQCGIP